MPCACSILLPSRLPQRRAPSNSSTPETEARGPHPTWPIKTSSPPPKPSALRSKAILHVRRTRMIRNRSLGSLGSSLVSADGIAITSHPVQRPFAEVGTSSKRWPLAMLLRWLNKMCESRSASGGGGAPSSRRGRVPNPNDRATNGIDLPRRNDREQQVRRHAGAEVQRVLAAENLRRAVARIGVRERPDALHRIGRVRQRRVGAVILVVLAAH